MSVPLLGSSRLASAVLCPSYCYSRWADAGGSLSASGERRGARAKAQQRQGTQRRGIFQFNDNNKPPSISRDTSPAIAAESRCIRGRHHASSGGARASTRAERRTGQAPSRVSVLAAARGC
ncbi:unnamed protein product [Ectocarpus sp. 4 AP-2014]